ncbi:MAG: nicotinamide mononucleotide transporter [Paludibacteraceae bacterium]|nr:nicotinamide mononucleotide transporter [Paludibacteraceae bacterium]
MWGFLLIGLAVQIITFFVAKQTVLSLICGMLGICSVILCSQGMIWTFAFGFAQILTYSYICYMEQLYGTLAINAYYFITQIYGIYVWRKRLIDNQKDLADSVPTRRLSARTIAVMACVIAIVSYLTGLFLAKCTDDSQPYLDAYTTIPALVAQVLMILAYREQWYIWFLIDVLYVVLWARAGDACLFAQHIFWCVNCIYGYIRWTKKLQAPA